MSTQDYDLSTLTNLRLNNKKAHQNLFNDENDDSFDLNTGNFNTRSHKSYSSRSPIKQNLSSSRFNESPYKKPMRSYNKPSSSSSYDDNQRYLDKNYYQNDSKQNDLKRERFLENLYSNRKPTSSSNFKFQSQSPSPSPLKPLNINQNSDTELYQNLGFRPRNKDIKLSQDFKLQNQLKYNKENFSPINSPIKTRSRSKYDYLDNRIDDYDHEKDTQRLKHYDDRYHDLIDRYRLNELTENNNNNNNNKSSNNNQTQHLNQHIIQLEDKLNKYKSTIKDLNVQLKQESYSKRELSNKLNDVEKYNEFLEKNFEMLYEKFHKLRLEKQSMSNPIKKPTSLKQDLKFDLIDSDVDSLDLTPLKLEKDDHNQDNDSTTLNLMNFKASRLQNSA
ncbi:Laminin subunit beta-1 [Wickerhamomyces ciferrii]|uniref:Laminin subunit beta-1 n=1 Tax=Wickerhamomyces ciferrii (strain ATCC 14091 / BCRC 22168 / CBS 111 / JCM 3599 / NBRC 0793 / NRRL Y-1031 F-60-10) TaxID=1206466 RepID=K0KRE2_WICCF|nr:Laminin subunit beta-1 [Wickerhamomyces ciferrii]CCH43844.1 Laminin subunit beta-1 [Wickerhamomyces ciferrii]